MTLSSITFLTIKWHSNTFVFKLLGPVLQSPLPSSASPSLVTLPELHHVELEITEHQANANAIAHRPSTTGHGKRQPRPENPRPGRHGSRRRLAAGEVLLLQAGIFFGLKAASW